MDFIESGTYNPHLEDCYICHCEWTEDNKPVGWYEHYICRTCDNKIKSKKEQP